VLGDRNATRPPGFTPSSARPPASCFVPFEQLSVREADVAVDYRFAIAVHGGGALQIRQRRERREMVHRQVQIVHAVTSSRRAARSVSRPRYLIDPAAPARSPGRRECPFPLHCWFLRHTTRWLPMPTYEYLCKNCGERFEKVQSFSARPLKTHDACGGDLQKVFHPSGVVFKGPGFYATDSRPAARSTTDSDSNGSKDTAKKDTSKPDAKPKAPKKDAAPTAAAAAD
jgi:putative FmdB family regulatory protein